MKLANLELYIQLTKHHMKLLIVTLILMFIILLGIINSQCDLLLADLPREYFLIEALSTSPSVALFSCSILVSLFYSQLIKYDFSYPLLIAHKNVKKLCYKEWLAGAILALFFAIIYTLFIYILGYVYLHQFFIINLLFFLEAFNLFFVTLLYALIFKWISSSALYGLICFAITYAISTSKVGNGLFFTIKTNSPLSYIVAPVFIVILTFLLFRLCSRKEFFHEK
ncbi:hypothetical protein [Cellulosilyticum ruminicola]|uniref:hypothetical protein n=1 Tax=Cellulosilyticum ruminicola TaxID=425254 RepID=UPI0006D0DDFF|nr:hypothetical protein [Cellulosilyticum ruminicola]